MNKPSAEYHFKRKEEISKYEGDKRLREILDMDHSEGIKNAMRVSETSSRLLTKEEFLDGVSRDLQRYYTDRYMDYQNIG